MGSVSATPALSRMLADGYGQNMVQALIDSTEFYVAYMDRADIVPGRVDVDNIHTLLRMLRAVLSDCYGINIK